MADKRVVEGCIREGRTDWLAMRDQYWPSTNITGPKLKGFAMRLAGPLGFSWENVDGRSGHWIQGRVSPPTTPTGVLVFRSPPPPAGTQLACVPSPPGVKSPAPVPLRPPRKERVQAPPAPRHSMGTMGRLANKPVPADQDAASSSAAFLAEAPAEVWDRVALDADHHELLQETAVFADDEPPSLFPADEAATQLDVQEVGDSESEGEGAGPPPLPACQQ